MEEYNEDDQILALKAWWEEYGRSIVFGVVLAVVTIGGWNFWDQYKTNRAEEASSIYYDMAESYRNLERIIAQDSSSDNEEESSEKLAKLGEFQESVNTLKEQYKNTEYAHYAALLNAKYLVSQNDLSAAEAELKAALTGGSKSIQHLTRLRLARVLFASEKYNEALKLVEGKKPGAYQSAYHELAGDVYYKMGEKKKAFNAYSMAKDESESPSENLEMKYYNLLEK